MNNGNNVNRNNAGTPKAGCSSRPELSNRFRANGYCPVCGSGDVWIVKRDQSKIKTQYEVYCQTCDKFVGKVIDPEPEPVTDERESYGIYEEIIANIFQSAKDYVSAYDLKTAVHLPAKEEDRDVIFLDQNDAFQYLLIHLSLSKTKLHFKLA